MRAVIITFLVLFLAGCASDQCSKQGAIKGQEVDLPVTRLENELFDADSKEEVLDFLKTNDAFADLFLQSGQYPHDSILAGKLFRLMKNPSIDTLYTEATNVFESFEAVERDLETAFGKLKTLFSLN